MKTAFAGLFWLLTFSLTAQRLPQVNLLYFTLNKQADGSWQPSGARFLNAFNPRGYNNQPCFFPSGEIYLTVQEASDTSQTDIFALDLTSRTLTRVTATATTAEYSPTLMPGGRRFSSVRVEEDGNQRLWSFPVDRSDNGQPEFPGILNVGYHCWLHDTLAALFIVGDNGAPHTLGTAGVRSQQFRRIAYNVGRCLLTLPNGQLAFVTKTTEKTWFLKTWNPLKPLPEIVTTMPAGSEDFAVLPDGTYICGN
ncbi:MAG TPA: hypothetical protein PKL15_12850, partial [Saprospiraceae bacterium]|nr:hypothetical protein [Saprospiraceae bacterium]